MAEDQNIEQQEEEISTEEILAMDFTPTQAMNFIYNGLYVAIEDGSVFNEDDAKILTKALQTFSDEFDKGKDIVIKVTE